MSGPRARWFGWVAVVALVVSSVTMSAPRPDPPRERLPATAPSTPPPSPSTVESFVEPLVQPPVVRRVSARQMVAAAEEAAGPNMMLGVAVLDVRTGELAVGRDGEREFMSASLSKLIVAVDVLDRYGPLDPADRELINRALSGSDDNAMNVLWGKHDGAGAIGRVAGRLGRTARLPPDSARRWGDTVITAAAMVTIYRHILRDMAPPDRALIVDALAATSAVAADGFGQHYGLLHQGASRGHYAKQAWVPYRPAGFLLHSAGVIDDHYAVALLSIQPHTDARTARSRLSTVAAAAVDSR